MKSVGHHLLGPYTWCLLIHVIDVQNRKDEGEGKKREAAKETHEPPPK